tara:strand:- start:1414 stop:2433 length:1020 start_codon:yes stop_codon:yes gene_type:complete
MDNIFIDKLNKIDTKRPPVWFMRQAGRILPSYQKLKLKYTFDELMKNSDLASTVSILPIKELGVDAIILFSDILVIPDALGLNLEFTSKGPIFHDPLKIDTPDKDLYFDHKKLEYIYKNITEIKKKEPNLPLIGFCGGPLTTFCFMFRGESSDKSFNQAIKFLYKYPKQSHKILNTITEASEFYIREQINYGIDCFQLFETYCGLIPSEKYVKEILPYSKRILNVAKNQIPSIFFPKNLGSGLKYLDKNICDFVSIDWQTDINEARQILNKDLGIQGNLDPRVLYSDIKNIEIELHKIRKFASKNNDFIFNLGHGFLPDIDHKKAKFIVDWVKKTNWKK